MPCYYPLQGWRARTTNASGSRSVVFSLSQGYPDLPVTVPCGRCAGCRLERSRQWAVRGLHELQMHEENCFITLTYADKYLPANGTLVKKHFQDFMKRLRWHYRDIKVSYFACGEYGDVTFRPHYHAILFGLNFVDRRRYKRSRAGSDLFTSEILSRLWPYGHCDIGVANFESIAYVARYILKKVTGKIAASHYERVDRSTGEIVQLVPEFVLMSLKPSIGSRWIQQFQSDVFPNDHVIVRGREMKPPRSYLSVLSARELRAVKFRRVQDSIRFRADTGPERLRVRAAVAAARLALFKRTVE